MNIIHGDTIVEDIMRLLVSVVACAIPLGRYLRVEAPDVVIHRARTLLKHLMVEGLTGKEGGFFLGGERPVEGDAGGGWR